MVYLSVSFGAWGRAAVWAACALAALSMPPSAMAANVSRGPYLQVASPSAMVFRWHTDVEADGWVRYGASPDALDHQIDGPVGVHHEISVTGLTPAARYYYAIGTGDQLLGGGDTQHVFATSPEVGAQVPVRLWAMGDSGTGTEQAGLVRDAYLSFAGDRGADLWLMLGDNAYTNGTDEQYQTTLFDMYTSVLEQVPLWPTFGNHDGKSAASADESGVYYDAFTLPRGGEAGGIPSSTEAYYSFDYANIHFVCLNSTDVGRGPDGPMLRWLQADLESTSQPWLIAYWHHPPYSKGSHDSDTSVPLIQMRENALPILEAYGVDLVLSGHSHSYERSFLLDGHYGTSDTLNEAMVLDGGDGYASGFYGKASLRAAHEGAVYVVTGSAGKVEAAPVDHPAMAVGMVQLGSVVIDVDHNVLEGRFILSDGRVADRFTLVKGLDVVPAAPAGLIASHSDLGVALSWVDFSDDEVGYRVLRTTTDGGWMTVAELRANSESWVDVTGSLESLYRVQAEGALGNSPFSNEAQPTEASGCEGSVVGGAGESPGAGGGAALGWMALLGLTALRRRRGGAA